MSQASNTFHVPFQKTVFTLDDFIILSLRSGFCLTALPLHRKNIYRFRSLFYLANKCDILIFIFFSVFLGKSQMKYKKTKVKNDFKEVYYEHFEWRLSKTVRLKLHRQAL